jgi:hypothetical protein
MSDADLEAYISERKHIIKTKGKIVGICFGILFGSWLLLAFMVGVAASRRDPHSWWWEPGSKVADDVLRYLIISTCIGTLVGIAFLPYRTRENIIKERDGISYLSISQIFAIVIGSGNLFFLILRFVGVGELWYQCDAWC